MKRVLVRIIYTLLIFNLGGYVWCTSQYHLYDAERNLIDYCRNKYGDLGWEINSTHLEWVWDTFSPRFRYAMDASSSGESIDFHAYCYLNGQITESYGILKANQVFSESTMSILEPLELQGHIPEVLLYRDINDDRSNLYYKDIDPSTVSLEEVSTVEAINLATSSITATASDIVQIAHSFVDRHLYHTGLNFYYKHDGCEYRLILSEAGSIERMTLRSLEQSISKGISAYGTSNTTGTIIFLD